MGIIQVLNRFRSNGCAAIVVRKAGGFGNVPGLDPASVGLRSGSLRGWFGVGSVVTVSTP
jgi:hypothetical protein